MVGGGGSGESSMRSLTTQDAMAYHKLVMKTFPDKWETYVKFVKILEEFRARRIDVTDVIRRVEELFKGHPHLIFSLGIFLPKYYEIILPHEDEQSPAMKQVEYQDAINYVNKVKSRFQDDELVYKSFIELLNIHRKDKMTTNEVKYELAFLFRDHPDLVKEFTHFLPSTSSGAQGLHAPSGRKSILRDRNSATPAARPAHVDRKDRVFTIHGSDVDKLMDIYQEQTWALEKERDRDEVSAAENYGLHVASGPSDDKSDLRSMYSQEFAFCEKVKERLLERFHSTDKYDEFLKCLHLYSREIITRLELEYLVRDRLGEFPDLMDGFADFLTLEKIDGFLSNVMSKSTVTQLTPLTGQRHSPFGQHMDPHDLVQPFDTMTVSDNQWYMDIDTSHTANNLESSAWPEFLLSDGPSKSVKTEDREGDRQREVRDRIDKSGVRVNKEVPKLGVSSNSDKDKHIAKPIEELDHSNSELCKPNSCPLPKKKGISLRYRRQRRQRPQPCDHSHLFSSSEIFLILLFVNILIFLMWIV